MAQTLAGLAQFKAEKQRRAEAEEARNRPRASYFNWKHNKNKESKDVVFVRFLQEFDTGVPGYREDRGLPITAVEHQAPGKDGFKRRANCTAETEGECYACERHAEDMTKKLGWHQRSNFYIWALVDYSDGEGPQPVVVSRTFGSSFVDDLILEVEEDPENQITDKMWKMQRTGSGKQTAWKLRKAPNVDLYDDSEVEVPDLKEAVLRPIPYAEQPGYYGAVYKDGDPVDDDDDEPKAKTQKQETGELQW